LDAQHRACAEQHPAESRGIMAFDLFRTDLDKLNSLTKYPSILTYHTLGDRGVLQEQVQIPLEGPVFGTEKIDGTNARMIFCPDGGVLVGSREDLLWERRDLVGNPAMGIVAALKEKVRELAPTVVRPGRIVVFYGEVYGRNIGGGAKNYAKRGSVGFRLFDALEIANFDELLGLPVEKISLWRDHGNQSFVSVDRLPAIAEEFGLTVVPPLVELDAAELPTTLEATFAWLLQFATSRAKLEEEADGVPEGVVIRTADRSRIAKIRREDYERTMKRRK
jgi:hypothetical protein